MAEHLPREPRGAPRPSRRARRHRVLVLLQTRVGTDSALAGMCQRPELGDRAAATYWAIM